jgi:uncharacterized Zn-binding protein involved in type VI secretion
MLSDSQLQTGVALRRGGIEGQLRNSPHESGTPPCPKTLDISILWEYYPKYSTVPLRLCCSLPQAMPDSGPLKKHSDDDFQQQLLIWPHAPVVGEANLGYRLALTNLGGSSMKTQHITRTILVSFLIGLVTFLAGCGNSGNGESDQASVTALIDAGCVNEEDEIAGIITAALNGNNVFEIDGQPVRITPDTQFEGGTATDLVVGASAEAEGVLDMDGVLVAMEVEIGDDGEDDDGDDAAECEEDEIAGIITAALNGNNVFEIDGQPVQITPDTQFEGGTATDLVVGANAEAEGVLGADGVLVAAEVEIGDDD